MTNPLIISKTKVSKYIFLQRLLVSPACAQGARSNSNMWSSINFWTQIGIYEGRICLLCYFFTPCDQIIIEQLKLDMEKLQCIQKHQLLYCCWKTCGIQLQEKYLKNVLDFRPGMTFGSHNTSDFQRLLKRESV